MSITEQILRPLLASSAARPLITHYDDAAGTRVELSVATLANWAAKTANWLVEEIDVEPGDEVSVDLPAHWQTAGVLLGAWWCGAHVVADADGARVAFTGPSVTTSTAAATAVVALDPMGQGLRTNPPDGAIDYLSDARMAGDDFTALFPIDGGTPALAGSTVDQELEESRALAQKSGISRGDRVLSTVDWTVPEGIRAGLLAPLVAGASLVLVTGADRARLDERRATERTTVDVLG